MALSFSPGDVLLFRGDNNVSRLIALGTCLPSQWIQDCAPSHVGICAEFKGRVMLFESTTLCMLPCEIKGEPVKGVQAHDPMTRINAYGGRVWKMRRNPENPLTAEQGKMLTDACVERLGETYDYLGLFQTGTIARHLRFWHPPLHHFICSRYVGFVCRRAELIGQDTVLRKLSPAYIARQWVYEELWLPPVAISTPSR